MTTVVIVGAQWGDEGKGKLVDLLTGDADSVVRFGGGANAGHTLVVGGEKVVFHLVPSAALHSRPRLFLGPGMVIDPKVLKNEIEIMAQRGLLTEERLLISERAHLVLPQHFIVDGLREKGPRAIGTTKRGIGPCYQDRAARRGVRVGDLRDETTFREKIRLNLKGWAPILEAHGHEPLDPEAIASEYWAIADSFRRFIGNATDALHESRRAGHRIVLEGAQGTMLDIDHGTYPYVTSSSVTAGGACTGSGLGPTHIDRVLGISKAYTTRVGEGPMPTELHGEQGEALRQAGGEFGATTGRPRRCGWLDIPIVRYAVQTNGISELALTKIDVLTGVSPLCICVAYELDGQRLELPPAADLERVKPIYEELPGWDEELKPGMRYDELPANARAYIERISELADCPIGILSVGPDRDQTMVLLDTWR